MYAYPYPEEMVGSMFYVGKGLGNRMYQHLANARQHVDTSCSIKIREIWEMGFETHPQVLYQNIGERDALILEKRFIRRYARLGELVNQRGSYAGDDLTSWERMGIDDHLDTFLIGSIFDPILYPERLQRILEKIPSFSSFMPRQPEIGSIEHPVDTTLLSVLRYVKDR